MAYNNLTEYQLFTITNLKDMYESNNKLLTNVTLITNSNFNSDNITNLVNNLIRTNNEIKNSIMVLLNTTTNNRQHNYRHHNHNNSNTPNYHSNRQNYLNNPNINNLFYTFFDPIEIFPTQSQIESATRVFRFCDIVTPLNLACPITLENFNDNDQVLMIRQCGHIFSNTGLISWFRTSCKCPVCRYDIRNYVSPSVNNLYSNIDLSSNILPSSINSLERNHNPLSLVESFLNDMTDDSSSPILGVPHSIYVTDNSTNILDISGNSLYHLFNRSNRSYE